jgi:hypothetical protein
MKNRKKLQNYKTEKTHSSFYEKQHKYYKEQPF